MDNDYCTASTKCVTIYSLEIFYIYSTTLHSYLEAIWIKCLRILTSSKLSLPFLLKPEFTYCSNVDDLTTYGPNKW